MVDEYNGSKTTHLNYPHSPQISIEDVDSQYFTQEKPVNRTTQETDPHLFTFGKDTSPLRP